MMKRGAARPGSGGASSRFWSWIGSPPRRTELEAALNSTGPVCGEIFTAVADRSRGRSWVWTSPPVVDFSVCVTYARRSGPDRAPDACGHARTDPGKVVWRDRAPGQCGPGTIRVVQSNP